MDPAGKVAVVTGGASGIGRATAAVLDSRGASVVVLDLANGVDVGDPAQFERALRDVVDEHGRLDILHNNAGIVLGAPDFPDCSAERIAGVVAVNVLATFVGTRLAVDAMGRSGGGIIVNMSSTLALAQEHRDPVYAATKAAVLQFTKLCAPFARTHRVRVNCIVPGGVDTPIIAKTGNGGPADWMRERLGEIDLLAPEAIAAVVLELIEDDTRVGDAVEVRNAPRP